MGSMISMMQEIIYWLEIQWTFGLVTGLSEAQSLRPPGLWKSNEALVKFSQACWGLSGPWHWRICNVFLWRDPPKFGWALEINKLGPWTLDIKCLPVLRVLGEIWSLSDMNFFCLTLGYVVYKLFSFDILSAKSFILSNVIIINYYFFMWNSARNNAVPSAKYACFNWWTQKSEWYLQ